MRWKNHTKKVVTLKAEHNGASIGIDSIGEYFEVYLEFANMVVIFGEFSSLAKAKKYVKNGMDQIDSIIQHLIAIQREVSDF